MEVDIDEDELQEELENKYDEVSLDLTDTSDEESYTINIGYKNKSFEFTVSSFPGCCAYCIVHDIDADDIHSKEDHRMLHKIIEMTCKHACFSAMIACLIPNQRKLVKSHLANGWKEIGRVRNSNSGNTCILFKKDI